MIVILYCIPWAGSVCQVDHMICTLPSSTEPIWKTSSSHAFGNHQIVSSIIASDENSLFHPPP